MEDEDAGVCGKVVGVSRGRGKLRVVVICVHFCFCYLNLFRFYQT